MPAIVSKMPPPVAVEKPIEIVGEGGSGGPVLGLDPPGEKNGRNRNVRLPKNKNRSAAVRPGAEVGLIRGCT